MTHTSTSTSPASTTRITPAQGLVPGIVGGLAGGVVFGMLMQMMDMIPMVAMLVGSESIAVGWLVHLGISAALGAGFGLIGSRLLGGWGSGILGGVAYGVVMWVLGALIAMPARLDMPLLTLDSMAWKSLMGHMIYGAILGAVAVALARKKA
jgi:predicted lipid-binding transport protein (Tim44 family)